jgi:hypothetical protein
VRQFELVELFEHELAVRHRGGQQQQELRLGRAHFLDQRRRIGKRRCEDLIDDEL